MDKIKTSVKTISNILNILFILFELSVLFAVDNK